MLHMKHSMNTCAANQIAFASQIKNIIYFEAFCSSGGETFPILSEYFEKDKKRWAKILVLHDLCLDGENRIILLLLYGCTRRPPRMNGKMLLAYMRKSLLTANRSPDSTT